VSAPNWKPLEAVLPLNQCGDWMWMGTVEHEHRTDSPPTFAQVPIETALEWALS
jgi:hypothetical protein